MRVIPVLVVGACVVVGGGVRQPLAGDLPPILWNQTSDGSGNGAPDQVFEEAFSLYDAMAADDFVVPATRVWSISRVETIGTTGTPGGATVDVTFFHNAVGGGDPDLPGTPACSATSVVPTPDDAGSFVLPLSPPCVLGEGTHWVGIQTHQSFGSNGQHFWSNRTVQSVSKAVWMNPNNGFGTGCTTFTPMMTCGVGGGASPDFLFLLRGDDTLATTTTTSTSTTSSTVPPNDCSVVTGASFRAIECRAQELGHAVTSRTADDANTKPFLRSLAKLEAKRVDALLGCVEGDAQRAAKSLKKAERRAKKLVKLLARKDMGLDDASRRDLRKRAEVLAALIAERRGALACPADASAL